MNTDAVRTCNVPSEATVKLSAITFDEAAPATKKENTMAEQTEQEQIDTTVGHVVGAICAFQAGVMDEFSDAGDTGIVEVRIENGKVLGVWVARLDDAHPETAPGLRAAWELKPDDIVAIGRVFERSGFQSE